MKVKAAVLFEINKDMAIEEVSWTSQKMVRS